MHLSEVLPLVVAGVKETAKHPVAVTVLALVAVGSVVGSWFYFQRYIRPELATNTEVIALNTAVQQEIKAGLQTSDNRWASFWREAVFQLDEQRCSYPANSPQRDKYNSEIDRAVAVYQQISKDTSFQPTPCSGL
jgi:hypothetical protein